MRSHASGLSGKKSIAGDTAEAAADGEEDEEEPSVVDCSNELGETRLRKREMRPDILCVQRASPWVPAQLLSGILTVNACFTPKQDGQFHESACKLAPSSKRQYIW